MTDAGLMNGVNTTAPTTSHAVSSTPGAQRTFRAPKNVRSTELSNVARASWVTAGTSGPLVSSTADRSAEAPKPCAHALSLNPSTSTTLPYWTPSPSM